MALAFKTFRLLFLNTCLSICVLLVLREPASLLKLKWIFSVTKPVLSAA